jgi:hypothetical protein
MSSSALRRQLEDVLPQHAYFLCRSRLCLESSKLTWLLHIASEIEFGHMEVDPDISLVIRRFFLPTTPRLSRGNMLASYSIPYRGA